MGIVAAALEEEERSQAVEKVFKKLCQEFPNLKKEDLHKLYKSLMERNPEGFIKKEDLHNSLQRLGTKSIVDSLYMFLDMDGDGFVTVLEYIEGMTRFSLGSKKDKIKYAFLIFDVDKNGTISKEEFKKCIELLHKANESKKKKEMVKKEANRIFKLLDEDNNESIDLGEFEQILEKFESLSSVLTDFISPHF